MVSNDVRRFDESIPYLPFLWCGPLELACVTLMISLELGAAAAFAGISTLLALIPLQVRPSFTAFDPGELGYMHRLSMRCLVLYRSDHTMTVKVEALGF